MKKVCYLCYLWRGKYRKFEKPKISYFLEKTVFSIICKKCKSEEEQIFKVE